MQNSGLKMEYTVFHISQYFMETDVLMMIVKAFIYLTELEYKVRHSDTKIKTNPSRYKWRPGHWWYDKNIANGDTSDPSMNADMISSAFWMVNGSELKIARSDDSQHAPLLQTTGNCLRGQTFRYKVTRYGDFRNGVVWASDRCLGNCTVRYTTCSGDILGSRAIGFWCDWGGKDGAVLMIGGAGKSCDRAAHSIGVTEADNASFGIRQNLILAIKQQVLHHKTTL